MQLIYYMSKSNIDQIYKKYYGKFVEETQIEKGKTSKNIFSSNLKLGKLLRIVTCEPNLEGKHEKLKTNTQKEIIKEDSIDRILAITEDMEKLDLVNIEYINKENPLKHNYIYKLPLKFTGNFNDRGNGTQIEIYHESENLKIKGVVSSENWISKSILNNLLYTSQDIHVPCEGILIPIGFKKEKEVIELNVQFILIGQEGVLKKNSGY